MEGTTLDKKAQRDARKAAEKAQKEMKVQKAQGKKPWEKNQTDKANDQPPKEGEQPQQEGEKKKKKKEVFRLRRDYVNPTPEGEKKDLSVSMEATYDPPAVEAAWYSWWEKKGFFGPEYVAPGKTLNENREKFVIVIPPPNVTGSLHIGHALTNSIEDALCRWHRMKGKAVVWVPGVDHAGIATQSVVEKRLWAQEKKTKYDLGREEFVRRVWEWKKEYGNRITLQLRRIGSSLDWSKECFTMDEKLSKAVQESFIKFYEDGLIYRDNRLVNWSCVLRTAISDIECDDEELEGHKKLKIPGYPENKTFSFGLIWEFDYLVIPKDPNTPKDKWSRITVATTRPETMLGDTAVAVHPDDVRYKDFHGCFVEHPFGERKIPIVCDPVLVDMTFGTGAVKVTPGHDPNDYETGKRHNLEFINILNDDGTMNQFCGPFKGMRRFDCREAILKKLQELGLYHGVHKENKMRLKICSRSGDVIEPMMKPQWWANVDDLARRSSQAVKDKELLIVPESKEKNWFQFLDNIQPWCISRQLWWGHQIPAWLIVPQGQQIGDVDSTKRDNWIVARSEEAAYASAKKKLGSAQFTLHRDPDVLDTWFSSGLFPFSVFGWPDNTEDMKKWYPTTLLETGHDILFFWVARMVMMGLHCTGELPFKTILLHSMVRDSHGRKMSKSLGNVIDPIDVIEGITIEGLNATLQAGNLAKSEIDLAKEGQKKDFPNGISECGTDALRFALCAYCQQGKDINLDIKRVESYRNFCNKLWNATKLALSFLGDYKPSRNEYIPLGLMDKWILHRLNVAIQTVDKAFNEYQFGNATQAIYDFWLYETCDVYLEVIKPIMHSTTPNAELQTSVRNTLYTILDEGFRLIHPFMPFISEELWQRLPRIPGDTTESIVVASYPEVQASRESFDIDQEMVFVQKLVKEVRSMLTTYNIPKSKKPQLTINVHEEKVLKTLEKYSEVFEKLAYVGSVSLSLNAHPPKGCAANIPDSTCEIYLHIKGLVNIEQELTRLQNKHATVNQQLKTLNQRIASPEYVKVPEEVREKDSEKLQSLTQEASSLSRAINTFDSLKDEL